MPRIGLRCDVGEESRDSEPHRKAEIIDPKVQNSRILRSTYSESAHRPTNLRDDSRRSDGGRGS